MIVLDAPPSLILPDNYQASRPAIIRPGGDLASYFPVEIDRKTRRAIIAELNRRGFEADVPAVRELLDKGRIEKAAIPFGIFKGGAAAVVKTSLAQSLIAVGQSSYTFTGYGFSTAATDRVIVIGVLSGGNGSVIALNTVTIGGISATIYENIFVGTNTNNSMSALAVAVVPTGTSGSVVVTFTGGNAARCAIGGWALYNLNSATPVDTDNDQTTAGTFTLTTQAGGVAVGVAYERVSATTTWTGLTEEWDTVIDSSRVSTGASANTTGATINGTCVFSSTSREAISVASFR